MRIAIMFLMAAPVLLAQPGREFFPWWDSPIARDMNLSPAQNDQIHNIVRDYRSRMIDLRAAVEKAEADFGDVFNDERIDQKKADALADRLATSRADLTRAFSQMSVRLRGVLTKEQWQELQRRRPEGPPRPAGPGDRNGREPGMHRQPRPAAPPPQGAPPPRPPSPGGEL